MSVPVVQCKATSRTGKQCKNKAIPGGAVCRFHGGGSPQVASKAAVRAEVWSWGLGDTTVDPGEILLWLCYPERRSSRALRLAPRGGLRSCRTLEASPRRRRRDRSSRR